MKLNRLFASNILVISVSSGTAVRNGGYQHPARVPSRGFATRHTIPDQIGGGFGGRVSWLRYDPWLQLRHVFLSCFWIWHPIESDMQLDGSDRQFDSTELYMTCCMPNQPKWTLNIVRARTTTMLSTVRNKRSPSAYPGLPQSEGSWFKVASRSLP
jgi:hypothetical protein